MTGHADGGWYVWEFDSGRRCVNGTFALGSRYNLACYTLHSRSPCQRY